MNRPDIRELECFVAVAEELSFARASRRIHLSQPPLSRHIQKLEAKLGVVLLIRNTRRVELTSHGRVFLEDARFLLRHLDRAVSTIQTVEEEVVVLNIGFIGAMLEDDMIDCLRLFRQENPGSQIRLHDMSGPELVAALGERQIDGAFIGTKPPSLPRDLELVIWKSEKLSIAVPEGHPLSEARGISLKDLSGESWVMIERKAAPTFYRHFQQLCATAGFRPRIIQETPKMAAILAMVAAGEAVTMIYESTVRPVPHVVFLPLLRPKLAIPHGFVFRKADRPAVLNRFIDQLRRRRG